MRLVNINTGETIANIMANHSMTLDEAINLVGEIINDADDPRFDSEDGNVVINGNRYRYDDINMVF